MSDRSSIVDVRFGDGVVIADFVNLYGCEIGSGTKVGAFVEIQRGVRIGDNCKISSHSFICEGVKIGDGVFVGHNVSFINDKVPKAVNPDGTIKGKNDWTMASTFVDDCVSIGTSATIMGGIRIGKNAMIGAGSVVIHDVPENAVVVGNPAHIIRYELRSMENES